VIGLDQSEALRAAQAELPGVRPLFARRPRVAEVAARAGVSTATVDRVINGRGGVRPKTAALVREAIRALAAHRTQSPSAGPFDILLPANSGRSTEVLAEALARAQRRAARRCEPRSSSA